MKVTLKQLWETGGSLQRFGQIKLKGEKIAWRAGRIHQAAMKHIEALQKDRQEFEENAEDLIRRYGIEVERKDVAGNVRKIHEVQKGTDEWKRYKKEAKELEAEWEDSLKQEVEFWGNPFAPSDLPKEFWGYDEVRDGENKVIRPACEPMMTNADIGALTEWLFYVAPEPEPEKAQAASGD